jgi:DUF971 family protein
MTPWPSELRVDASRKTLHVAFESGERFALAAEYLRVESPSAEVQGHRPEEKRTVTGKQDVTIAGLEPVGNYAVRIVFSDGHDSGLFSWEWLLEMGREEKSRWGAYLAAAGRKG